MNAVWLSKAEVLILNDILEIVAFLLKVERGKASNFLWTGLKIPTCYL